jgi:hypothetical protein
MWRNWAEAPLILKLAAWIEVGDNSHTPAALPLGKSLISLSNSEGSKDILETLE